MCPWSLWGWEQTATLYEREIPSGPVIRSSLRFVTLFSGGVMPPTRHVPHSLRQDKWSVCVGHFASHPPGNRAIYKLYDVRCTVGGQWIARLAKYGDKQREIRALSRPPTTPAAKIQRVSDHTLRLRNIAAISLTNGSLGTINVALFKSIATLGWRENAFSWTRPSVDRLFLSQADVIGKCYFSRTVTRQSNNLKSLLQCKIENLKRRTTIYAEILSLRRETFNYTPKCEVQSSQLNFWKIFDEWIGEVGIILRWSIGQDFLEFLSRLEDLWWDVTRLQLKVVRLQPALPVEISGQLRTRESDCSFWSKRCLTSKLHAYCIH